MAQNQPVAGFLVFELEGRQTEQLILCISHVNVLRLNISEQNRFGFLHLMLMSSWRSTCTLHRNPIKDDDGQALPPLVEWRTESKIPWLKKGAFLARGKNLWPRSDNLQKYGFLKLKRIFGYTVLYMWPSATCPFFQGFVRIRSADNADAEVEQMHKDVQVYFLGTGTTLCSICVEDFESPQRFSNHIKDHFTRGPPVAGDGHGTNNYVVRSLENPEEGVYHESLLIHYLTWCDVWRM